MGIQVYFIHLHMSATGWYATAVTAACLPTWVGMLYGINKFLRLED